MACFSLHFSPMRALTLLFLSAALSLCVACSDSITSAPTVTVSVQPLRYFVENIAGPHFEVNTLVPAGASPETYELTPRQVVEVSDSRLYFSVGTLGFERERLDKLTANAPRLVTVNVSDSIPLMEGCDDGHEEEHGGYRPPHLDFRQFRPTNRAQCVRSPLQSRHDTRRLLHRTPRQSAPPHRFARSFHPCPTRPKARAHFRHLSPRTRLLRP